MPGRPPKPTAIKVLEGNPGHRPLNQLEPEPPAGQPDMPADLSKEAKAEWIRIVPILMGMKVLTRADGEALGGYCEACAMVESAKKEIKKYGMTVRTMMGRKKNPAVAILESFMKIKRAYLSDFGLSPASRTRVKADAGEGKKDPMEEFLKRPKVKSLANAEGQSRPN